MPYLLLLTSTTPQPFSKLIEYLNFFFSPSARKKTTLLFLPVQKVHFPITTPHSYLLPTLLFTYSIRGIWNQRTGNPSFSLWLNWVLQSSTVGALLQLTFTQHIPPPHPLTHLSHNHQLKWLEINLLKQKNA